MSKYYMGCPEIGKRLGFSKSHTETLIKSKLLKAENISTTGNHARWRCSEDDILDFKKRFEDAGRDTSRMKKVSGFEEVAVEKVDISSIQILLEKAALNVNAAEELKAWKEKARKASELLLEASIMLADLGKE